MDRGCKRFHIAPGGTCTGIGANAPSSPCGLLGSVCVAEKVHLPLVDADNDPADRMGTENYSIATAAMSRATAQRLLAAAGN